MIATEFDLMVEKFTKELEGLKYLYYKQFTGALGACMKKARISPAALNEEVIEAFKYAICNIFHGGCEPEFKTEEDWINWENFNMDAFFLVTESRLKEAQSANSHPSWRAEPAKVNLNFNHRSPFIDKSKPYFVLVEEAYGTAFEKKWLINEVSKCYGI